MPNWKVWPSPAPRVRAFQLELVVCDVTGLPLDGVEDVGGSSAMVQVQWSGGGRRAAIARRAVERNCTAPQRIRSDGCVSWWEGLHRECKLKTIDPQKGFKSWIVKLEIHGFGPISKYSSSMLGKTQLDVSNFASMGKARSLRIPIECCIRGFSAEAELTVTLGFSDPHIKRGAVTTLTRAQSLRGFSCSAFPQTDSGQRQCPGTTAEHGGDSCDSESSPHESARSSASGLPSAEETAPKLNSKKKTTEARRQEAHDFPYQLSRTQSVRGFLSWSRGKLGFKSVKHPKDDPLPCQASGDGGVDHDRGAQPSANSASPSSPRAQEKHRVLDFEDDGQFEVGSWEERTVASRDGRLELVTEVFLASIDQRSEKAAGESACSVLAAVIADWLHRNPGALPLRFQFDELVREGSSEWRRLCADESRVEKFSDRHFDLDTVLGAKVRPLTVVTGMSYVGFLGMETTPGGFEYLHGAMSFDSVWEELLRAEAGEERVYISGWNDHFFVLKLGKDAVYLVDTLGERLFEGCNQAYILKFDKGSKVYMADEEESIPRRRGEDQHCLASGSSDRGEVGRKDEPDGSCTSRRVVCEGLAACKEFIKGFLAALPLRQLRDDMERGLVGEAQLHRLLQIEFHYTFPL